MVLRKACVPASAARLSNLVDEAPPATGASL